VQWDCLDSRILLGDSGWLKLHEDVKSRCRRICAEVDVVLPPRQETIVPVRVSHQDRRDLAFVGVTENIKIPNLSKVYSGRSVFRPDSPTCGYVANTADRLQVLKKGTRLGNIEPGDIVGPAPPEPTSSIAPKTTSSVWIRPTTVQPTGETKEMSTEQVIECITKSLPTDLTDCQRRQVRRLIERNESIFSKSEYGIGTRTKIASYPLPLIDNCVNAVAGASWFSTLDLRSGYYNTPLADEDRDKQVGIHYSQRLSRIHCYAIWIDMRTQRLPETHGLRLGRTVVRHLPRLF